MISKITLTALLAGQAVTAGLIIPRDVVTVTHVVTNTIWAYAPTETVHHTSTVLAHTTKPAAAPTVKPGVNPINGLPASPNHPIVIVPVKPTVIHGTTTYVPYPTLSASGAGQAGALLARRELCWPRSCTTHRILATTESTRMNGSKYFENVH